MIRNRTKWLAIGAAIVPLWLAVDLLLKRIVYFWNPDSDFFQAFAPYSLFVEYLVFPCVLFIPLFALSLFWDVWHSKRAHE